jgi:hypothetical protein
VIHAEETRQAPVGLVDAESGQSSVVTSTTAEVGDDPTVMVELVTC